MGYGTLFAIFLKLKRLHTNENNGPVLLFRTIFRLIYHLFSSLKAMPAKITQKRYFGQCSLIQFVQYRLHNSTVKFSVFATCTCLIMHLIYPQNFA